MAKPCRDPLAPAMTQVKRPAKSLDAFNERDHPRPALSHIVQKDKGLRVRKPL
jgi:hypothetical protein